MLPSFERVLTKPASNSYGVPHGAEYKMMDIDILPVQHLDFHVLPLSWPFAAGRRTEIEGYFTHLRREKPQLWNGRVLLLRDFEISGATLQGTMFETDYASFVAWRDWGFPDRDVRACFAMGALLSRDGAFLLGVMNAHTAGAGGIYFPSGVLDPGDVVRGRVDFDRNVRREIVEETGLSLDDVTSQRKPRPCRRPERKPTSSLAVASPKMQKKRADEWRHTRFEIGGAANNVNVGKFR